MKRLACLAALAMTLSLAMPALAQEQRYSSGSVTEEQYSPGASISSVKQFAKKAVEKAFEERESGTDAYEAALTAALEAGVDEVTANAVATEAVSEISEAPEGSATGLTVLPATGGVPWSLLGGGMLVCAGLLTCSLLRQ